MVTRSLRGSGFGTRISSMLESYAAIGHQVDVYHYRFAHEQRLPDEVVCSLGGYVTLPLDGTKYRQHARLLPALAWCCLRASEARPVGGVLYDVVQAETSNTWAVARVFPALHRIAVFHDDDAARLKSLARITPVGTRKGLALVSAWKYSRWQRIVLREADRIWFASKNERDRLLALVPEARTSVVPNGASDELWSIQLSDLPPRSDVLFVAPGFYQANWSGISWFLKEVWPQVKARVPGSHVRVVGIGWEQFDPHPDVSFVGWRESLVEEYSRARVVIAPLFAGGGTKLKVLEAMAAGRAVVTTPSGVDGLPPSPGLLTCNDAGAFASAMVQLLVDSEAAVRAGAANRKAIEGMRWSQVWRRASTNLEDLVVAGP